MNNFFPFEPEKSTIYTLEPVIVKKPWGVPARLFSALTSTRTPDGDLYGEVWTASAQVGTAGAAQTNVIAGTPENGTTLHDLILRQGAQLLGSKLASSLTDQPARGKTESWYFREVHGIVKIITGVQKHITRARFEELIRAGYFNQKVTIEQLERDLVTTELARKGESYILKPGTLHTVWPLDDASYCVIDEVQEGFGSSLLATLSKILVIGDAISLQVHPSDAQVRAEQRADVAQMYATEPTIRVSDFGRGRPVQPDLAMNLIDFGHVTCSRTTPLIEHIGEKAMLTHLLANRLFAKDRLQIGQAGTVTLKALGKHYIVAHVVAGSVSITTRTGLFEAVAGQTVLIPAHLGVYTVEAVESSELLIDYVPDLGRLMARLENRGYTPEDICKLDGECFSNDIRQEYTARQVVVA